MLHDCVLNKICKLYLCILVGLHFHQKVQGDLLCSSVNPVFGYNSGTTSQSKLCFCCAFSEPNCNLVQHGRNTTSELGVRLFLKTSFCKTVLLNLHTPSHICFVLSLLSKTAMSAGLKIHSSPKTVQSIFLRKRTCEKTQVRGSKGWGLPVPHPLALPFCTGIWFSRICFPCSTNRRKNTKNRGL